MRGLGSGEFALSGDAPDARQLRQSGRDTGAVPEEEHRKAEYGLCPRPAAGYGAFYGRVSRLQFLYATGRFGRDAGFPDGAETESLAVAAKGDGTALCPLQYDRRVLTGQSHCVEIWAYGQ